MIEVRSANADDAQAIATVHVESWRVGYRHVFTDAVLFADGFESHRHEQWARILATADRDFETLVAAIDGEVVGFSNIGPERPRDDQPPPARGEVMAFYLHPRVWGRGAADRLMSASLEFLRDLGFSETTLWVLDDNPRARGFYEKAGWSPTGRTTMFDRYCDEQVPEVEYARSIDIFGADAQRPV